MCYVHSAIMGFFGVRGVGQVWFIVECCVHPVNSARFFFSFATQSSFSATDMNRSWGSFPGKEFLSFGGGRREMREKGCWLKKK